MAGDKSVALRVAQRLGERALGDLADGSVKPAEALRSPRERHDQEYVPFVADAFKHVAHSQYPASPSWTGPRPHAVSRRRLDGEAVRLGSLGQSATFPQTQSHLPIARLRCHRIRPLGALDPVARRNGVLGLDDLLDAARCRCVSTEGHGPRRVLEAPRTAMPIITKGTALCQSVVRWRGRAGPCLRSPELGLLPSRGKVLGHNPDNDQAECRRP